MRNKYVDWVSDDITFCMSKCSYKKCMRHPSNIRHPEIPHSYSDLKDTEYCIKHNENKGEYK